MKKLLIFLMFIMAQPVYAGVTSETFGKSGPGYAIVQLMLIAAFGTLACNIVSALGRGQIANFIKLVTVFSCIGVVISQIWAAISTVAKFFGISL